MSFVRVTDFRIIRPRFESPQKKTLDWLAKAHAASDPGVNPALVHKMLSRYGCSPDKIEFRGHELADFVQTEPDAMKIFKPNHQSQGMGARTEFYHQAVSGIFGRFYAEEIHPPQDLLHVSCTGYVSPSAAQKLVAEKKWGSDTRVTHLYHMGCYAAFPALRVAEGLFQREKNSAARVDIVHTELCSLHLDPSSHLPEQLVVQTLFADGFIRYSLKSEGSGLEIIALEEEIIGNSEDQMSWSTTDWGMQMTLSRKVPETIAQNIEKFLERLSCKAKMSLGLLKEKAIFAIHPGGPKIIDLIEEKLGLRLAQTIASRTILKTYGNMSSATLPHVWDLVVKDPSIEDGSIIVSLAFGPGLTFCGGIFRKV